MAKKANKSFFSELVKDIGDPDTFLADDGLHSSEFSGTIDTGSYLLNAAVSGSIFGGIPNNKIIAFAGESATGKTFFILGIVKKYLDDNSDAGVFYYDTEAAVTKKMMQDRGIDTKRVIISEQVTVQNFRTSVSKTLDKYMSIPEGERPPVLFVLDSLGSLSTEKETTDIAEGSNKRDMTRPQLIRGTFRALSLKLAKARAPMLITNHVYSVIGAYVPTKEISGGEGLKYASSQIILLSKKKDREGNDVVGNIIHCKMYKSRFTKENKMVDVRLSYDKGLNRYYGLIDLAEKYGMVKKVINRYEFEDGTKVFGKQIDDDPEKYFTKDFLKKLDEFAGKEFKYGQGEEYLAENDTPAIT